MSRGPATALHKSLVKSGIRSRFAAIVSLSLAVTCNPATLATILRRPFEFSGTTKVNILVLEALFAVAALFLWFWPWTRAVWTRLRKSKAATWLIEPLSQRLFWFSLVPVGLVSFWRQLIGWRSDVFHWWHPAALIVIAQGMIVSALFVTGVAALAHQTTRRTWAAMLVGLGFAMLSAVDAAFLLYSKMRISWSLAGNSTGAASIYLDGRMVAVLAAFVACIAVAVWLTVADEKVGGRRTGFQRCSWAAIILLTQPAGVTVRAVTAPLRAVVRDPIETHYSEAKQFSLHPALNLAWALAAGPSGRLLTAMPAEDEAVLKAYRSEPASTDVAPIGPPMRRIVFVTMESMSLPLLSRYNEGFDDLTPVLDSLPQSHPDFRSVSLPTAYGLASHLCSHPNGLAVTQTGHRNALPAYLANAGWRTCLMQSASLQFQSGARRFREMGYEEMYGRDEAVADPQYKDYVSGWGLCDRKVYERAVRWLDQHRSGPVFLHVLTADTHAPVGRLDWHDLSYPSQPEWLAQMGPASEYLEACRRADYDVGLFLRSLEESGLLDENTAIIITADHSCPGGPRYDAIPGTDSNSIERIPWILVTKRGLMVDSHRISSQIDTAPTIAQLAGLPSLKAWWGTSLLVRLPARPLLAWRDGHPVTIDVNGAESPMSPAVERAGWLIETADPSPPAKAADKAR